VSSIKRDSTPSPTPACENLLYGFQGGPTGPLAPPIRRARLRSRCCSRYGGVNAGRLARKGIETPGRHENLKD